jgi:hypothetical protein
MMIADWAGATSIWFITGAIGLVAIWCAMRRTRSSRGHKGNAMYKGTVTFTAKIKGNGLTFTSLDFNPNEAGVSKVEIECAKGDEITSTIHVHSMATEDDGRMVAAKVNNAALDRISFFYGLAIERAKRTSDQFAPENPQPGVLAVSAGLYSVLGFEGKLLIGIPPSTIKNKLELKSPPGEHHFSSFRSARQSESPVEEFMHLYLMLLALCGSKQEEVDAFIVAQNPSVPQTPIPRKKGQETIYTRLRNELAHKRTGVNIEETKVEMAKRIGELADIVRKAIELKP